MNKPLSYLKYYKKEIILGPIFKLTEAIFELIVPLVVIQIIDVGIKNGDVGYVIQMGIIMVILGLVGLACSLTCQYYASRASQGFGTKVRNALFRHINTLSHSEIDKFGTPSLITRLNNDVNQVQVGVAMIIRLLTRSPFLVVGAIIMSMGIDMKLSIIFLIATPLIVLVAYFVMSKSVPLFKKTQKGLDRISLITRENLSGARVIRAFSSQKREKERFEQTSNELKQTAIRVGKLSALLTPLTSVILNFAIIAVIWFGGIRVDNGTLTQGEIIALVNYLTQILIALIAIAQLVAIFTKAFASVSRVSDVFELSPSITDINNQSQLNNMDMSKPAISFNNVSFKYSDANELSLTDISFAIKQGETFGIIGGTGSGKSTLINLIPRFYDVTTGEIEIDGVNVKDYLFKELRGLLGIVPQKAILFSGTLRENMKWGKNHATDEEIAQSLEIAQASEFVNRWENGYDTHIEQGGKNLSGGQKQRLTIARAVLRNPQILILDDSASALDFATDAKLRKAIQNDIQNITVIIVSQRVNAVKNADRIICLDDGKIVGMGTHEELTQTCEEYKEICLTQLSEDEI